MTNPQTGYPGAQQPHEPTDWAATQQYVSPQPQQPTEVYPPYAAPPAPPQHSPKTPWWRRWWALALAGGVVGLIIGLAAGGGSTNTKTVAGPTVHSTATVTAQGPAVTITATTTPTKVIATHTATVRVTYTPPPPPAPKSWSDGTYVVGTDIQPGVYKTSGKGDGSNSVGCYWARLSSLNTQDIIDNGIVNGMTTIEVHSGDKALELSGGCQWSKVG